MTLLTIIFLGIVLFISMRVIIYFTGFAIRGTRISNTIIRVIPVVEFSLWTVFLFWAAYVLFDEYSFMPSLLTVMGLILCLAIGWYIVRDLISGMILKSENAFDTGQYLKTNFAEGMIKRIGYLSLMLETTNGETIKIPYSKLANQVLIRPQKESINKYSSISLEISDKYNHSEIKEKITRAINSTPWVIYSRNPEIIISSKNNNHLLIEIRFVTFSDEHTNNLKKHLKEFCTENFPS
ncbi:MAG: mechanosensitive ion channel family protein [Bacteroidetes bacterium]|nr:mechanosensitive ion channel family protein [Bacteroidota bacterium]